MKNLKRLKALLSEIAHTIDHKKQIIKPAFYKNVISGKSDAKLTEKVHSAIVEFCNCGYMDYSTFEELRHIVKDKKIIDYMEKHIH